MHAAAVRAGRSPDSITLVAVTKTVEKPQMLELIQAGQLIMGENRPQVLRDKVRLLEGSPVQWQFLGSLQSNKIKYVYPVARMIHSVDRVELFDLFGEWFRKTNRKCPCLLEVHISNETTKQGFSIDEVIDVIRSVKDRQDIDVRGLMGMAPFVEDRDVIRASFRTLANLFNASRDLQGLGYQAKELSMGMSGDFEIAIEEGATLVRVGSALLKGVK